MVLPLPGGPTISRLWPPAAAISRARLACSWPRTSARSAASSGGGASPGLAAGRGSLPSRWLTQRCSEETPTTSSESTSAASAAFSSATARRRTPAARRQRAMGRTPVTGRTEPSSASSPMNA
jgi:hypothetical protein